VLTLHLGKVSRDEDSDDAFPFGICHTPVARILADDGQFAIDIFPPRRARGMLLDENRTRTGVSFTKESAIINAMRHRQGAEDHNGRVRACAFVPVEARPPGLARAASSSIACAALHEWPAVAGLLSGCPAPALHEPAFTSMLRLTEGVAGGCQRGRAQSSMRDRRRFRNRCRAIRPWRALPWPRGCRAGGQSAAANARRRAGC
jgi:hypothetical protein